MEVDVSTFPLKSYINARHLDSATELQRMISDSLKLLTTSTTVRGPEADVVFLPE